MISVIICSINNKFLQQVSANISNSIGVPFEIIAIDNNIHKKSIASVYNMAAGMAKFNCLCFLHEDIIIHSKEWGGKLIKLLSDERIGLAGVSGAVYKSKYAGTWSACDKSLYRTHSIQHFKKSFNPLITNSNPDEKEWVEVAVIDGVFMATTKKVFKQYQFDENLLKGFHGYDIDYSLQVGSKYKVAVTYNILIEHFSSGTLNGEWLKSSLLVHKKWKERLPESVVKIERKAKELSDYLSSQCVLNIALLNKKNWLLVASTYFRLIFKYFHYNKLKYTRQLILFFLKVK